MEGTCSISPSNSRKRRKHIAFGNTARIRTSNTSPSASPVSVAAAQYKGALVGFVSIEQILGKLGRLAKTQGQHACRQRIEAAGMARLRRAEQMLYRLQCPI